MNETAIKQSWMLGDDYVYEIPKLLSKEEIKYFSQVSAWRFLAAIAAELLTITVVIWFSEAHWSLPVYVIAVIIIGSRLHAFTVLMHEATHYRGVANRKLNDIIGEMLAWPVTITMKGYRDNHFAHHREPNSDNDPDWVRKKGNKDFVFPQSLHQILFSLLQYLLGFKIYHEITAEHKQTHIKQIPKRLKNLQRIFFLTVFVAAVALGFWKQLLLYWLVPVCTSFLFFEHIRSVAEHFAVERTHMLNETRTVVGSIWERWLFAPYNINYHIEHHLYPSVPFFRLPELHKHLMGKQDYVSRAHITKGYLTGLLKECSSKGKQ